jgi:hypothetical protein
MRRLRGEIQDKEESMKKTNEEARSRRFAEVSLQRFGFQQWPVPESSNLYPIGENAVLVEWDDRLLGQM